MNKTWNIYVGDNYRTRSLTKTTVDETNYGHSYRSRHLKDTKQRQPSIIPVLRNRTEHKLGYVAFVWLRLHHRQLPDSRSAEQIKLKRAPGKYNLPLSVSFLLSCSLVCFSMFLLFSVFLLFLPYKHVFHLLFFFFVFFPMNHCFFHFAFSFILILFFIKGS